MIEALSPILWKNGWDYCILWKLSSDQRSLTWMGCCCSGADQAKIENGVMLPSTTLCRDTKFQHPWTNSCSYLSEFPSSISLDSSLQIHAQVLMSNKPTWQHLDHPGSTCSQETIGARTRVLVPVMGGIVELFVSKHVTEDQQITDFVMSQCNTDANFLENNGQKMNHWISGEHNNIQNGDHWDNSVYKLFDPTLTAVYNQQLQQSGHDGDLVKQEVPAVHADNSGSEGSEGDDDDGGARTVGRNGKRPHSKNLVAERKRRKKLNDRLYALRALVPKITKMDRASILGDAVEYVMELQKQVKELEEELENETNHEDEAKQYESNFETATTNLNGLLNDQAMELDESPKQSKEHSSSEEKINQMEPHVEVKQLDGNEFYLKILCEHKFRGFTRLMEAISSLGLEVTNATVTTQQTLVLNVFTVQRRDNGTVQVEQVRDSLMALSRGPVGNCI